MSAEKEKKPKESRTRLSEAEKKRLERYEKMSEELALQGYTRKELTIDMNKANLFAIVLFAPLFLIGYGAYTLVNHDIEFPRHILPGLLVLMVLIVAHELIHGLCWSLFTPHHFKDIEFGIMKPSMSPYCTCLVPLSKGQHIFGTVMPLIVLGIIPMILGVFLKSPDMLFLGILLTNAAAGDILIIFKILGYKSNAKDIVYMDHPTEGGGVIFER